MNVIALNRYYDDPDQFLAEPTVSHEQEIDQVTHVIAAAHTCRGRLRLENHHLEDAIADLTTAIGLNPSDAEAYQLRARAHFELGAFEDGDRDLKHFDQLHRDDDNSCDRWQFIADYELVVQDQDGREQTFNTYPLSDRGYDDAVIDAGRLSVNRKRSDGSTNTNMVIVRQCFRLRRVVPAGAVAG